MTTKVNSETGPERKEARASFLPGITPLSLSTILFGLVFIGFMIQVGNRHAGGAFMIGGLFALPLRPVMFVVPLILISGLVYHLKRKNLYTRAEMVCVLGALLVAPPVMTEGFWSYAVGAMVTIPQTSDMNKLDGMSDKMWPHGENLVEGILSNPEAQGRLEIKGQVDWREFEVHPGVHIPAPELANAGAEDRSFLRIPVPLFTEEELNLFLDEPYLLTLLVRAENLEAESYYYCRIFYDDSEAFASEVFSSRETARPGFLHPDGFLLKGSYGVEFSPDVNRAAFLELGLVGRGRVAFADPTLANVSVITEMYEGRKFVTQKQYDALPEKLRGRLLIRPDSMLSPAGLKLLVTGGIPFQEWINPTLFWLGFIVLLLSGTFTVAVIMRRQWLDNERYPIPMAQIPIRLLGLERSDEADLNSGALPPIWKNRIMWAGFGVTFFWCIMKLWAAYNSSVPNLSINVPIGPYFSDPSWGGMWNVNFKVASIFLALALFMELNILMTLVLGFFLFRAQYWFGYAYGLSSTAGYPFTHDQMNGTYITYAVLVIFFTRKYLWQVLKRAVRGGRGEGEVEEVMSYRSCLIGLLICYGGVAWWADWAGLGVGGMLVFYTIMLLVSFVAAKLRAECGVPFSTYFPWGIAAVVPLLGGAPLFVPAAVLFIAVASDMLVIRSFLLVPGIQVEMIELGRRARVIPRHMIYVFLLGLVGAWLVGGWFVLSNSYSTGMGSASEVSRTHIFNQYGSYIKSADLKVQSPKTDAAEAVPVKVGGGIKPETWGALYGAGTVTAVTVLRQFFAGFWFHPIGFLVGGTWMAQEAWGSLLLALVIRFGVLKLGGAATVRNKLLPFATGIFLGGTAAYVIYTLTFSYMKFFVPGAKSVWWSIWAL